ncbi:MAG: TolC family protein [Bdellovibrionaceae bacterium]|nr:TolC family protein [Pseudobdellovibrionaceae bacterium]
MSKFYFVVLLLISSTSWAQEQMPLKQVWESIRSHSPLQESARLQTEAAVAAESRAGRHWLPRLYVDAKSYKTNDPGASFFGLLQQRSLTAGDFNPDFINRPEAQIYTRGALGMDLALYEGGMKSAQVDVMRHSQKAQEHISAQVQLEQFAHVSNAYVSVSVLQQQRKKLEALSVEIDQLIKRYQLGSKSNPVGYSGLLGMKSLGNRLKGLLQQYQAQEKSYYAMLSEMGLGNRDWRPEPINTVTFVNKYLSLESSAADSASHKILSLKESTRAGEFAAKMEKARFLPRVGAFAEGYMFKGERDTADGYMTGVYLQWNLYNPADHGQYAEAKMKAAAASKYSEALAQQERAEKRKLQESIGALRENIKLLDDSYGLLNEQSKMAATLFKNGSMSALQVVEVMNRKADLIDQQTQAELGLISSSTATINKNSNPVEDYLLESSKGAAL